MSSDRTQCAPNYPQPSQEIPIWHVLVCIGHMHNECVLLLMEMHFSIGYDISSQLLKPIMWEWVEGDYHKPLNIHEQWGWWSL